MFVETMFVETKNNTYLIDAVEKMPL